MPNLLFVLLSGFLVGLALLRGPDRLRPWTWLWLVLLTVGYLVLGTLAGAEFIAAPLTRGYRAATAADVRGAQGVVLLTGCARLYHADGPDFGTTCGTSERRVIEAARVFRLLGHDVPVVVSGRSRRVAGPRTGEVFRDALVALGVPAGRILLERESRNTREHALNLPGFLTSHGIRRFVLVTSEFHMLRAEASLRPMGLDFIPSVPAPTEELLGAPSRWLPSLIGLAEGQMVVHEYLGLAYYWGRGWLGWPARARSTLSTNSMTGPQ